MVATIVNKNAFNQLENVIRAYILTFCIKYVSMHTNILFGGAFLKEYDFNTYGGYHVALVKLSGMTQIEFYTKANIKKPYFYDIVNGKVNPPPRERQYDIVKLLQSKKKVSQEEIIKLFELAAEERDEVPADIYKYLSDERRADIRKSKEYKTILHNMIG